MLQAIGVGNKVRRTGLHSVVKMGPNLRVIKGGGANVDKDSSANDRLIINNIRLALEADSLQWMESEKELPMRTPRSSTTFATCMESPGLPVARDN